jgi:preprotein translocase subunit SecF
MEFFKQTTRIDFMKQRNKAALFSLFVFVISLVGLVTKGLNVGLDFKGGSQVELHYDHQVVPHDVRMALQNAPLGDVQVQTYGSANDVLVKLAPENMSSVQIGAAIQKALGSEAHIVQIETIGPQVGKALVNRGVLAILVCLLATMAYIALRFEYRFAASAAVALIHDPILILGIFAWFQIEFNLISLAALLTILGYSLNDTIVVYDRVRENFRKVRRGEVVEIMNLSINQTLSRTIMTSSLTLVVVLALLFFGGEVLFGFSLALSIGILIGTYSSIFVAGALAVVMGLTREHLIPQKVELADDMP